MSGLARPHAIRDVGRLIDHASNLKGDLLDFAWLPRFRQWLGPRIASAAGADGVVRELDAITEVDAFTMSFRFPDGSTLIDKFLMSGPGRRLPLADKRLLETWRDYGMEDVFEVRERDVKSDSLILLSLSDDLEYRVYSNLGLAPFPQLVKGSFMIGRIFPLTVPADDEGDGVPLVDGWLISGNVGVQPKSAAKEVARVAVDVISEHPEGVFRNPARLEQAWNTQRRARERFIEFFGADEVVIPAPEAEARMSDYYRHVRQRALEEAPTDKAGRKRRELATDAVDDGGPAWELPSDLRDAETIGVIYDETDGISFVVDYAMAREVFENPKLVSDKRYAGLLRGYLRSEDVTPVPLRRLAAAYPETADEVFRRALGKKGFTWAEHGETLLRRRKPWWYEREPLPQVTVLGDRLLELAGAR